MTDLLKPCPFCGEKPIPQQITQPNGYEYWRILCQNKPTCPASYVMVTSYNEHSLEELIDRWNTRGN